MDVTVNEGWKGSIALRDHEAYNGLIARTELTCTLEAHVQTCNGHLDIY
jgi:hypothetical protein